MQGAYITYKYCFSSFGGNKAILRQLGIEDINGNKPENTDYTDNPFFSERIVKLIVKSGYSLNEYRYFDEFYLKTMNEKMVKEQTHDPFIDKRFLGELDKDGKYPCDVSSALNKISEDTQAEQQAQLFSLDNCDDVEIYQYCLVLLYQYFKSLQDGNKVDELLKDAIILSGNDITIKNFTFDDFIQSYVLDTPVTIDLSAIKTINNMMDLSNWIRYVLNKKGEINNELQLYVDASKYLVNTVKIKVSDALRNAIKSMRGTGNKPIYDFFTAYLDWYNKD